MGLFSRKNHFVVAGRTVVLTGGSQGMGRSVGRLLAQKGANVVIVARNKEKLSKALEYIRCAAIHPEKQRFHAISADLTLPEESTRLITEVVDWNNGNPPDIVWANAGGAVPGLFAETSIEALRSQMDLNYWSAAYLAHATLKIWSQPSTPSERMKASSSTSSLPRHLIMTSSVVTFVGLAGYCPYAPAKAAMRSLSDTLRSEMSLYNGARRRDLAYGPAADMRVHTVFPGTILTPGLDAENKVKHAITKVLEEGDLKQTEHEAAAGALRGLERGGYLIATQLLGEAMKVGMLGGSPRNNWFVDTVFSWVIAIAWLVIGPDMEGKVFKYGKQHGTASL